MTKRISLSAVIMFIAAMSAFAQEVKLKLKDVTVKQAMTEVSQKTGCTFVYEQSDVDVNRIISVDASNQSDALAQIFKGQNVSYKKQGDKIIIGQQNNKKSDEKKSNKNKLSGIVTDIHGEPLIGATVVESGTSNGTVTDVNGHYELNANPSSFIEVSYLGHITRKVKGSNTKKIVLSEDSQQLNELLVIGYGVQRKRDVTTSVASLKGNEIADLATTSIEQALVGRMAGVQITQPNGAPGAGMEIKVRGTGTITAGNSPLYVVDGVPLSDDSGAATGYNVSPLSSIDAGDIESIEILKDASSAAIYGSRGSNGVVVITTKQGLEGKPQIKYDGYVGVQSIANKIDVLDAYEYAQLVYDAHNNSYYDQLELAGKTNLYNPNATNQERWDILKSGEINDNQGWMLPPEILPYIQGEKGLTNTDWQKEVLRTGIITKHNLSISGGTKAIKYLVSGNYQDEQGIVINSDFNKFGIRGKIDATHKKWKLGANINLNRSVYNIVNSEGRYGDDGVLSLALGAAPIYSVYDEDGNFNYAHNTTSYGNSKLNNPVAVASLIEDQMVQMQIMGVAYAQYDIMKGLNLRTQGSWNYRNYTRDYYRPASLPNSTNRTPPSNPIAESRTKSKYTWVWETTLNYNKTINKIHKINALAGWTAQRYQGNANRLTATDLPMDDLLHTIPGTATPTKYDSTKEAWSMLSGIGRAQYNYLDRYMFSAAIRADGSSRFGKNTKWGYFPSVSGAWYISEEKFMKPASTWLTNLKLRASWGLTGNMNIGNYATYGTVSGVNYVLGNTASLGYAETSIGNPDLSWEKTSQVDLGLEIGLFKWLNLEIDVYKGTTKDMLLQMPVMQTSGFSSVLQNIGKLENKGLEITLSTNNRIGKVKWTNNFNFSMNRNKVLSLGDATETITQANKVIDFITKVGEPIGNYYTYVVDGIYQNQAEIDADVANGLIVPNAKPGDFRFKKFGENETIDGDDKQITGNYMPDFTYGYSTKVTWNHFDFALSLQGVYGNEIANINRRYLANMEGNANQIKQALDRWQSESIPGSGDVYRPNRTSTGMNSAISTWHIEDGSYMRIREITLGYTLPKKVVKSWGMTNLRFYLSAFNPFTFTKYSGYNPEVSLNSETTLQGVDYGTYPLAKNIIFGVNLSL